MYVLKDLWWGNVSPSERFARSGTHYKKVSKKACDKMDSLLETLTPEAKEELESIQELDRELSAITEEDAFLSGFRLGARMILDVVGEYNSPFETLESAAD